VQPGGAVSRHGYVVCSGVMASIGIVTGATYREDGDPVGFGGAPFNHVIRKRHQPGAQRSAVVSRIRLIQTSASTVNVA